MFAGTVPGFESPSLGATGGVGPAYELKFLVEEALAGDIKAWAQARMMLDPHGDPALGGAYRTTSLYVDTPELDVFYRTRSYKRRKFRVRRYGSSSILFLERKSKWGDRVAKRRSSIPEDELQLVANPMSLMTWPGNWFQQRLQIYRLQPACRILYQRTAYVGSCSEGALRLTMDRNLHGILTSDWSLAAFEGGLPLLSGQVIVEFKFHLALPAPFKELIARLGLNPHTVSKYRLCREAWGVPQTENHRRAADA